MILPIDSTLLVKAVEQYGADNQLLQTIEECAELIVALRHNSRGRIDISALADEIADVMLMTYQLRHIIGADVVDGALILKQEKLASALKLMGA